VKDLEKLITREFNRLFYEGLDGDGEIYRRTSWMGVPCLKCPLDLWIYQEILFDTRPDLIIETGSFAGGSALYLAHICDLIGNGKVVSIDISERPRPMHRRITYLQGSSTDPEVANQALASVSKPAKVMVILDSDHTEAHVLKELEMYGPHVSPGCYLVVEDTNINGHPVRAEYGRGPFEAVQTFIASNQSFVIDLKREKYLMTFNPKGFLRRLSESEMREANTRDHEPPSGHWSDTREPNTAPGGNSGTRLWEDVLASRDAQLAKVNTEFSKVGEGFAQALHFLALRENELLQMNTELAKVSAAFSQALEILGTKDQQLSQANAELAKVGAGFSQALEILGTKDQQLSQANAELAKVGVGFSQALEILAERDRQLTVARDELSRARTTLSQALQASDKDDAHSVK